ncbi:MAG TPA: hypothetical protein PLK25_08275, partial [Bacteroidales bacterium]|nr:hypothetical protein [Bacteroidales bacterium]
IKNYKIMKNSIKFYFFIIISLFIINLKAQGEIRHIILDYENISVDSINILLNQNSYPFKLTHDTTKLKEGIEVIIIFYNNNANEIFRTNSNLDCIYNIKKNNSTYYLLFFYDYVGYDFFILIQEKPFKVFQSDEFNYEQEGYILLFDSLDLSKNTIEIRKIDSKKIEKIKFNELKNE